ncbi:DUF421 domain-containing protein [Mucilaginibacter sp. Bleaf8]|uniref:DUF421 domain-containing protein n=1 Tax=Mucilaginibacter sp. Bleaf8 TaxID=2834430 RepID=UPI001BD045F3|nr:YetF domain-containing protein [Mucilaginibacter sp. Bleaf8]MBS7564061.1 DUF421 domain-containing protein [Mucilaginibacter sp. Bleaf8]
MQQIKITDWQRILLGDVPAGFYIELVIRALIVYLILTVAMRLLGKRMSSQMGRNDMTALVSLAAAIGVPLQAPDRGILAAVIIAIVVVYIGRWVAAKTFKSQSFEKTSEGNIDIIIKDAVLDLGNMKRVRLTRERLVAQLRSSSIKHTGQVKRLYMEANGNFTLIKEENPKPGLSVLPRWDKDFNAEFKKSDELLVCQTCGLTQKKPFDENTPCPNCGDKVWTAAVEI